MKDVNLFQVLAILASGPMPGDLFPDNDWKDITPEGPERVELAFMCEEETHIRTYPEHPILVPWYGCTVTSISVDEPNVLTIWIEWEQTYQEKAPKWLGRG